MHATDTLKVKKVRFFVEPKVVFITPNPSHVSGNNIYDIEFDIPGGPGGYIKQSYNWQNKSSVNFGVSGGLSIRLSKYFNYEISLAYYHYNLFTKGTVINQDTVGNYYSNQTFTNKSSINMLGIGNGLAFKYKKFRLTNSVLFTTMVASKSTSIDHDNVSGTSTSTTSFSDYKYLSTSFYLMSEHKIGYSLCKNRLETYVGVNVLYGSPFIYMFEHPGFVSDYTPKNIVMPFASVKINF